MKKSVGITVAVIAVVAFGVLAVNSGYELPSQFNQSPTFSSGVTPSTSFLPTNFQVYGKNFNVGSTGTDSLDVTIVYGDDTELNTICWDAHGSDDTDDWTKLGSLSEAEIGDANMDIDEGQIDANGNRITLGTTEMWCEFNLESAQDFFVDHAKIIRANDRIDSCIWVDANDDTDGTYACRYNLIGITAGVADPNNEPTDTLDIYLFDEDADSTIMDTSVASIGSVAQSATSTEVLTHIDMNNSADVVVISDIRFRNNLTSSTNQIFGDDTEICFQDSTAEIVWYDTREPVGCLSLDDTSLFDRDNQASTTEWFWSAGSDYKNGILVIIPKNANTQVDTNINIKTDFSSATDAICIELAFKYIDAFENRSSFDAVDIEVTADSVSDECTIS